MKETELINEIKSILASNEHREKRYSRNIEWLETWKKLWASDRIRVGVIGVTSSGKSTLINALMRDNLLTVAVRPSSSQLVSCSYAPTRSAVVYFLNGDKKHFGDDEHLREIIIEYSNEKYNDNNRRQVSQLELSTPRFALGDEILLVDSPGLNATGFEKHEKLTLETLLPTVDVVIFVTTVKSEVDRTMKQVMNTIAKHNCPVMIVQNMLDAVRGSVDGKKSASVVANERKKRVLLAIEQSNLKNNNDVKVSQISAISAFNYLCNPNPTMEEKKAFRLSRFNSFLADVKELVEHKQPEIESQRINSLIDYIEELIRQENDASSSLAAEKSLNTIHTEIEEILNNCFEEILDVISELEKMYHKYFKENLNATTAISSPSPGLSSLRKIILSEDDISEIKKGAEIFEARVLHSVQTFSVQCASTIEKLNMSRRDFWSYNGLPRIPEAEVKVRNLIKTRMINKKGILNSLKRLFSGGKYGTECEQYKETVIDNEATLESAKNYIKRLRFEYVKTLESWHIKAKSTVSSVQQEVQLRINAIQEKTTHMVDANEWEEIREALEKCKVGYGGIISPTIHQSDTIFDPDETQVNSKLIKMPNKMHHIQGAAENYLYSVQQSCINYALHVTGRKNYPILIISNNQDNISDFLCRFYQIQKDGTASGIISQLSDDTQIACNPSETDLKNLQRISNGSNIFLLINGLQFHTENESTLRKNIQDNLTAKDALFYVIHDFETLANGNAITESVRTIHMDKASIQNGANGMILISHKNPIFNMAVIASQIAPVNLKEETSFFEALTDKFSSLVNEVTKKQINNIFRSFITVKGD